MIRDRNIILLSRANQTHRVPAAETANAGGTQTARLEEQAVDDARTRVHRRRRPVERRTGTVDRRTVTVTRLAADVHISGTPSTSSGTAVFRQAQQT